MANPILKSESIYITLSNSILNKNTFSKLNELPINFLFKTNENEWLGCEIPKNQIENFNLVYNQDRKLKKIEEIFKNFRSIQPNQEEIKSQGGISIEKVDSFEYISDKPYNSISCYLMKGLELMDSGKSFIKSILNEEIEKLFTDLKLKLVDIKMENIEKEEFVEEDLMNMKLDLEKKETNIDNNVNTYISNNQDLELFSRLSVPNSNFISNLGSNFSEEVYSIPTSHINNFQSSEEKIEVDSNQVIKSVNLLSPINSSNSENNFNAEDTFLLKKKRRNRTMIDAEYYSVRRSNIIQPPKILTKQERTFDLLFK